MKKRKVQKIRHHARLMVDMDRVLSVYNGIERASKITQKEFSQTMFRLPLQFK